MESVDYNATREFDRALDLLLADNVDKDEDEEDNSKPLASSRTVSRGSASSAPNVPSESVAPEYSGHYENVLLSRQEISRVWPSANINTNDYTRLPGILASDAQHASASALNNIPTEQIDPVSCDATASSQHLHGTGTTTAPHDSAMKPGSGLPGNSLQGDAKSAEESYDEDVEMTETHTSTVNTPTNAKGKKKGANARGKASKKARINDAGGICKRTTRSETGKLPPPIDRYGQSEQQPQQPTGRTKRSKPGRPAKKETQAKRGRPSKAKAQRRTEIMSLHTSKKEYEVERIIGSHVDRETGIHYYQVKWKGFSEKESTWEPRAALQNCMELIKAWERRKK